MERQKTYTKRTVGKFDYLMAGLNPSEVIDDRQKVAAISALNRIVANHPGDLPRLKAWIEYVGFDTAAQFVFAYYIQRHPDFDYAGGMAIEEGDYVDFAKDLSDEYGFNLDILFDIGYFDKD